MKKTFVVGIAGGSASGKSSFCDRLEKKLGSYNKMVIHMDDYFKPEEQRPYSKGPVMETMYVDDNHPDTINLEQLHTDLKAAISSNYDLIILEGLLVLWDEEIFSALDLKLFVDCRPDERIVRRLRRNMTWGLAFDERANVYLDMVRYRHDEYVEPTKWKADFILNGSKPSELAEEGIVELIKSNIQINNNEIK
ncbi:AAA family ATPase [Anaerocolumna sp. AGMB13025]|uniref:uridine kinase family protein n=1 Tax=Anaerocolumna sp. AGMB13025 TaxID=3039116 RepID=UPI00241E2D7E|nr:AAA family ATPase [Anaerocolumna sp. AGMB13025]WFR59665.1 AAA family ATPase [Anaerocolumna sp. AGMB13025]